jgi:hypothetical protein
MIKITNRQALLAVAAAFAASLSALPGQCDTQRLPGELGRMEGPRDMNLFAIEPSILNERFYTSGKAERRQFIGNVLPAGAPIPDNDAPLCEKHNKEKSSMEKSEKIEKSESGNKSTSEKIESTEKTVDSTSAAGSANAK